MKSKNRILIMTTFVLIKIKSIIFYYLCGFLQKNNIITTYRNQLNYKEKLYSMY